MKPGFAAVIVLFVFTVSCSNPQKNSERMALLLDTGYEPAALKLMAHGIDPNATNTIGESLLLIAIQGGMTNVAVKLLDAGASGDGASLLAACANGYADIAKAIRDKGFDASDFDGNGVMLREAAYRHRTEVMRLLLECGDDPDASDGIVSGDTALMIAAQEGYADIVELLLAHGADVNLRNTVGFTALYNAETWTMNPDSEKIAQMLRAAGATE